MQELQDQLKKVEEGMAELVGQVDPEDVENIRDYLTTASKAAKEQIGQAADTVKEFGGNKSKEIDQYAKENPWKIAAAGVLIGAAIASLFQKDAK